MVKGSCLCGEFAYEFTGEPATTAACHCYPCRKTSGTTASYNFMVPADKFSITKGTPKRWSRKGESGKDVTYNNCPTCSTLLFVEAEAAQGVKIVKWGGINDLDFLNRAGEPKGEIYCRNMHDWEQGWSSSKKSKDAT